MRGGKSLALMGFLVIISSRFAVAQNLHWNDNEQIREAVLEAERRLMHPKCAYVFGKNLDSDVLRAANYRILPLGKPRLMSNGTFQLVNAVTIREENLILINIDGAFVHPQIHVGALRFNYSLDDLGIRVLFILHELGHLIGVFGHDGGDPVSGRKYTAIVREGCF